MQLMKDFLTIDSDPIACCSYGTTADGRLVNATSLEYLKDMGFDAALAAEALKQVTACHRSLLHIALCWSQCGLLSC